MPDLTPHPVLGDQTGEVGSGSVGNKRNFRVIIELLLISYPVQLGIPGSHRGIQGTTGVVVPAAKKTVTHCGMGTDKERDNLRHQGMSVNRQILLNIPAI